MDKSTNMHGIEQDRCGVIESDAVDKRLIKRHCLHDVVKAGKLTSHDIIVVPEVQLLTCITLLFELTPSEPLFSGHMK